MIKRNRKLLKAVDKKLSRLPPPFNLLPFEEENHKKIVKLELTK